MRHEGAVCVAQFSPDGKRVVTASADNTARLWDAGTGKPLGEPMRHEGHVSSAAVQPRRHAGGDRISGQHRAAVGCRQRQGPRRADAAMKVMVASAQFSPDGTRVVTASWDNTARLWDAGTGKPWASRCGMKVMSRLPSSAPTARGW